MPDPAGTSVRPVSLAASGRVTLPRTVVVTVLVATILPTLLNLCGVDFSAVRESDPDVELTIPSAIQQNLWIQETSLGQRVHTILEWSAVCVAVCTVVFAFTHYHVARDVTTPIIGTALFFSGMLDVFHTLAINELFPTAASDDQFVPFTWAISRSVNAFFIAFSAVPFLRKDQAAIDRARHKGIRFIILVGILFALLAYSIIHLCAISTSLPTTIIPAPAVLHRPWDLIALVVYLIAGGLILPRFHRLHPSLFSHALLLSIVPHVAAQLHAAFGSTRNYDNHFMIADYLKIVAYVVPFIGLILDYKRAYKAVASQHATEAKLRVARDVLKGLLPEQAPHLAGFDIAAVSTAADSIGGDYFDYVPMPDGRLAIVVADVSGHEIGSSILLSQTRAYLRALAHAESDLSRIMTQLNRFLIQDVRERWFVELFLMRLDPRTSSFSYAAAGHEGYLLKASGEVLTLANTGPVLGVVEGVTPGAADTPLARGDMLLVFTDGVSESISPAGEQFGRDRTIEFVRSLRDKPAREIVESLNATVREFRQRRAQSDDITVALVKRQ